MIPISKPRTLEEAKEVADKMGIPLKEVEGGRWVEPSPLVKKLMEMEPDPDAAAIIRQSRDADEEMRHDRFFDEYYGYSLI